VTPESIDCSVEYGSFVELARPGHYLLSLGLVFRA
jgi:hypothetical protein